MLTEQKKRFARNYIANGGNATQAALKAGYSKKSARSQGQRLLTDADIKQMLDINFVYYYVIAYNELENLI